MLRCQRGPRRAAAAQALATHGAGLPLRQRQRLRVWVLRLHLRLVLGAQPRDPRAVLGEESLLRGLFARKQGAAVRSAGTGTGGGAQREGERASVAAGESERARGVRGLSLTALRTCSSGMLTWTVRRRARPGREGDQPRSLFANVAMIPSGGGYPADPRSHSHACSPVFGRR